MINSFVHKKLTFRDIDPEKGLLAAMDMTPETIISITALITNVNNPRVKILIGRVNKIKMGLKNALSTPKMAAARKAAQNPEVSMPSIK